MNWDEYKEQFELAARREGKSEDFVARSLSYAEPLARAGFPIIYDFVHLSNLLGFETSALRGALESPTSLYFSYFVPKRAGGYRRIDEPVPSLRQMQRWILDRILNHCRPHAVAMAFCRGRSIKDNAKLHLDRPMVLSLDVKDFFSSIGEGRVRHVFQRIGYRQEVVDALVSLTVLSGCLPQGAPTSPAISNLVMFGVDTMLSQYAQAANIQYTRYADDMTFSGVFGVGNVITVVRRALDNYGLTLNEAKTRLMLGHERQEVTGVVVNKKLQAPRSVRRTLRQEVHYVQRFGLEDHEMRHPSPHTNRRDHLRGLAEFILFLNPQDRDALRAIEVLERVKFV